MRLLQHSLSDLFSAAACDQDHVFGGAEATASAGFTTAPVTIGDNVWLGAKVMVTEGVSIGVNSVVGASLAVTRDIPPNCLALGAPAQVVRRLS